MMRSASVGIAIFLCSSMSRCSAARSLLSRRWALVWNRLAVFLATRDDASKPSTKEMAGVLKALGFERSVLVVTGGPDENVKASLRNLRKVSHQPAAYLNVASMLEAQGLLMTVDAVRGAESLWGGEKAATRRVKAEA